MPRKPINPATQAASFAAATQKELAQLRKSLKATQDSLDGLTRAVKVPIPSGGRNRTSAVRSGPNIYERAGISAIGGFLGRGLLGEIGLGSGSFYTSGAQQASLWSDMLQDAQRIL